MVYIPKYIVILFFIILVDYCAGLLIEKFSNQKKLFLFLSLFVNIGTLGVFKYYNFFRDNVSTLLGFWKISNTLPILQWALPIGLSFHTFQALSYTIEVYRGNQKAENHLGIYALYVMFYPQLVAGPIERPQNILHQFREEHVADWERIKEGLSQMLRGFIKKVVIADRLALLVDLSYNNIDGSNGLTLAISTLAYAFQIYCDFSGYSDIGIGAAKVMGIRLMTNFNAPYLAKSVTEFWQRWHISLSTWFRDYLYIPLGGNRVGVARWIFNIFIVFLISGLWHGAKWTFVIWGALHGFYLIVERLSAYVFKENTFENIPKPIRVSFNYLKRIFVFLLISFTWVFFRAPNVKEAFHILNKSLIKISLGHKIQSQLNNVELWFCLLLIISLFLIEKYKLKIPIQNNFIFWTYFISGVMFCYLFGIFNQTQFIYFQF